MPTTLLIVWTFAPPVVLNLRERGEATLFMLIVALCLVVLVTDDLRVRVAAGAFAVASPALIQLVAPQDWGWPFWMMGILFGWLSAEQMRRFQRLVVELRATRQRLADQAVHLERRRIAVELHDLVGHSLSIVLLNLTGARRRLQDDPAAALEILEEAEAIGRSSLAEIRRSVAALREADGNALMPTPGATDIEELVARTAAAGASVSLQTRGELASLDAVVGLAVYRVVQESLSNATRHAPGSSVRVTVAAEVAAVEVAVADHGVGRPGRPAAGGIGLIGMRERVESLRGTFHAGPTSDGWRVDARIPATTRQVTTGDIQLRLPGATRQP